MAKLDPLTKAQRSERMSRIKNKDTKPEMIVRRLIHGMGYRYRLHGKKLPGKPDLVFKSKQKVIFVHGCFWHQHDCGKYKQPKSRVTFWLPKLKANVARDTKNQSLLRDLGFDALIIWECELRDLDTLKKKITDFLQ